MRWSGEYERPTPRSVKVCLLAPEFLPNRGGVGTYSVDLAKELGRKVDLTVVTLTREDTSRRYSTSEMEEAVGEPPA
ncbi:MAG TPA: hypothetical protein VGS18_02370 [Thermoplasmata archaeon]|nr:hypothetical protein [Thermoplasmata archaeon]